jgi:L-fucose isomerase-like protein
VSFFPYPPKKEADMLVIQKGDPFMMAVFHYTDSLSKISTNMKLKQDSVGMKITVQNLKYIIKNIKNARHQLEMLWS